MPDGGFSSRSYGEGGGGRLSSEQRGRLGPNSPGLGEKTKVNSMQPGSESFSGHESGTRERTGTPTRPAAYPQAKRKQTGRKLLSPDHKT